MNDLAEKQPPQPHAAFHASCDAAWSQPWSRGAFSGLPLNPFDDAEELKQQQSLVTFCEAPLGTLGPLQTRAEVVACSHCPQGYELGDGARHNLRCRPTPTCNVEACKTCQLQPSQPFFTGPCDMCISYGCDPNSNRCSCG